MKRALEGLSFMVALLAFAGAVQATPIRYFAELAGSLENPPNASPGAGTAEVDYDPVAHTLRVAVDFQGLLGTTTASHIHCCAAFPTNSTVATVIPTFVGFPLGVTSGTYDDTYDLTLAASFNPSFVTNVGGGTAAGAEAALAAGLAAGQAYLNIHTNAFGGGEIRGFLAVPEPSSPGLLAAALALLALARIRIARRRSRSR